MLGLKADDNTPLSKPDTTLNPNGTNGGRTLGPLGSRIVGEGFFRLMKDAAGRKRTICSPQ